MLGFAAVRQRGSYVQCRHADGRGTTVPLHKGRDIARHSCGKLPRTLVSRSKNCWAGVERRKRGGFHGRGDEGEEAQDVSELGRGQGVEARWAGVQLRFAAESRAAVTAKNVGGTSVPPIQGLKSLPLSR
jgi:hypothetical protein